MSERGLGDERVEAALAECVEHFASEGYACVQRVSGGDAELAARLEARLQALARLGLLAPAPAAPVRIGPYRVLSTLGSGGMGSVYLAQDDRDARRVAIKVAHLPVGGDEERGQRLRARFEREMRAAAALDHPGFVRILDVGESEGRPWFAMEHLEGTTLATLLDEMRTSGRAFAEVDPAFLRARLAAMVAPERALADPGEWGRTYVETVCRWSAAIADALGHAHAHGVVHRDVKPSNVMIGPDAAPKVFDLGLARLDDDPALTRTGEFAGSPYYVAPEQLAGQPGEVDARCDVYALGVTLFELLAWRRPFEGANTAQVFRAIQTKEPPLLSRLNPLVPRDLETIVSVALEKDRARRYPSMQELAADLRRFLAFQPVQARPSSATRRLVRWLRRSPARAAAVGLAATVVVGLPLGLWLANRAIRGEQARTEREAQVKTKAIDELVRQFALSEDERDAGETISARELLDRGVERSLTQFGGEPELQAALFEATGAAYANLGLADRAIPLLDRALALRESSGATDDAELARLLERLALAHLARGDAANALLLAERGLRVLGGSSAAQGASAGRLELALADANELVGDVGRARQHYERAARLAESVHGADSAELGEALFRSARSRAAHGELGQARVELERALELQRRAWSPDVAAIVRSERELARVFELAGEPELAAAAAARALALAGDAECFLADVRPPFVVDWPGRAEYDAAFQEGITALQARQHGRAIERFERCLLLRPGHPTCAYNLACAHALAGELDRAFERLALAADWGFGTRVERLRTVETDADLATLRDDARFAPILTRMRSSARAASEFAARDATFVPPAVGARALPLLVLLHDRGSTPERALDARWRERASALGFAVLAPCGALAAAADPEAGMHWLSEPADLARRPELFEPRVATSVRRFSATRAIDRSRVWIAGLGEGGLVAFDVATRAPGLFRGVLVVDGPLHPDAPRERVRRAASMGLEVELVLREGSPRWTTDAAPAEFARRLEGYFAALGFHERAVVTMAAGEAEFAIALERAITSLCR